MANAAACDDGNACTKGDACANSACAAGAAADCDDKNPCTADSCDKASGCVNAPQAATCSDGDGCTDNDTCKDGKCGTGAALTCDDKNPCTDDACDKQKGCGNTPNTAACSDGNACTQADACADAKCKGVPGAGCNDANPCTDDACDPGSGNCVFLANAATCSDGNECSTGDACAAGACSGQPSCACADAGGCDDKNPCTVDACTDGKCAFLPADATVVCSDGNACTESDACTGGKCAGGKVKACDDSNVCTDDACQPALGCVNSQNTKACDDGNAGTSGDTCTQGVCVGVATGCTSDAACDDKDACTDDACVAGKCNSKPAGNGKACEEGNACTVGDACLNGKCLPGKPAACDDKNPCTDDACEPKTGKCLNANNATPCDDGSACTVADACKAGKCQGGAAKVCNDQNPCTDDACDAVKGCSQANNTAVCQDGSACTVGDACKDAKCAPGAAPVCDDKNACTDDSCDAKVGCVNVNNATPCDDKNACTTLDACNVGACKGGPAPLCDDKNPCTDEGCDMALGCTKTDNTSGCDDGNACTTADLCAAGKCVGGLAPDCDDKNPCTTDACDPKKGCGSVNVGNGTVCGAQTCNGLVHVEKSTCFSGICLPGSKQNCDDGNGCTDDTCEAATGCKKTQNTAACNDGTACTKDDKCKAGSCVAGAPLPCSDGNECTLDQCDPVKGCVYPTASDGTVCIDPSCAKGVYSKGSKCTGGSCEAIAGPKNCDDKNTCTDDLCSATGGCSYQTNSAPCNDENQCTQGDACVAGVCSGGGQVVCDDKNVCTTDSCDVATGCKVANNTKACDDATVCTTDDTCSGGQCKPGVALVCDDKNGCTVDSCDAKLGCQTKQTTAACDDLNACNFNDICSKGVCKGSGGKDCDDKNPCTVDSCDADGGCTNKAASKGVKCADATCSGAGYVAAQTCDGAGACSAATPAQSCDDKNVCTTDTCNALQGCVYANNTNVCDDANACTKGDSCANGGCIGVKLVCDDKNLCTDDVCEPASGCKATNNTALCDDANKCTTKDVCAAGNCLGSVAPDCDDKNPCTNDSCDTGKGCVHANNTAFCDDNDKCTSGDVCKDAVCAGPAPVVCDDKNVCTNDSCDALKGCVASNNTAPCDDGSFCTDKDACAAGACKAGATVVCDDKNPCTTDTCDPKKGCTAANVPDTTVCLKASCNGLTYQANGTCTAGSCGVPPTKSCDDKIDCTADTCDAVTACSSVTKAWGTSCTTSDTTLKYPFCIANLCTGFEIKTVQSGGQFVTQGGLTGIDRGPGASGIYASGWDNFSGAPVAVASGIVESPLGATYQGAANQDSRMYGVRNRLMVGATDDNQDPVRMSWQSSAAGWNESGPSTNNFGEPLYGVDFVALAGTVEQYYFAGSDGGGNILSRIGKSQYIPATGWTATQRIYVATAEGVACQQQLALDARAVYAATDKAVFIVGRVQGQNGGQNAVVAFYDGNTTSTCGGIGGFNGLATVTSPNTTADFSVAISQSSTPPVGLFQAAHGSSASHVLVAGQNGTIFTYDAGVWSQQSPVILGAQPAWGTVYNVRGVGLNATGDEAWLTGEVTVQSGQCRQVFALHGAFAAATGKWTWNKLQLFQELTTCNNSFERTRAADAWIDPTTASAWFVGSQGTDNAGVPVSINASRTRQLIVRVKTK